MWSANFVIKSSNHVFEESLEFNVASRYNFDVCKPQLCCMKNFFTSHFSRNICSSKQNQVLHDNKQECVRFSEVPVDYNMFCCIMSSLVNFYVVSTSLKSQRLLSITEKENVSNLNVEYSSFLSNLLTNSEFIFHKVQEVDISNLRSKLIRCSDWSVHIYNDSSQTALVRKSDATVTYHKLPDNSEFTTFVTTLDQDYTKSSKGYSCREVKQDVNKSFSDIQDTTFEAVEENNTFDSENSDSDDQNVSDSDEAAYENIDPVYDGILSRYFDTLESNFTHSETVSDSDSDDSIMFSDNIYEADPSDNSVVFSESFEDLDNSNISHAYSKQNGNTLSVEFVSYNYSDLQKCDLVDSSDDDDDDNLNYNVENEARSYNTYSQHKTSISDLKVSFSFQGLDNPCFESDDRLKNNGYIKMVNNNWKVMTVDVSEEPRIPKKVSFVSDSELVTVRMFEPEEDDPSYSSYILDQIRFKNRIQEFEKIMTPFLTDEHRTNVFQRSNM